MEESLTKVVAPPLSPLNRVAVEGCVKMEGSMSSENHLLLTYYQGYMKPLSDFPVIESTSPEWTDEKHRLYLNFIETSFVQQLQNHKILHTANQLQNHNILHSDLLDWHSKKIAHLHKHDHDSCSRKSSGQFKVLRDGFWQEANHQPKLKTLGERCLVSKSPWIQHFKSKPVVEETHNAKRKRKLQESFGSTAEVSDQNFPDAELEEEKLRNLHREKKMKNVVSC